MAEGRFITLEGGEGTGKSTQAQHLAAALRAAGQDVVVTREPGGTEGAEAIRALLVTGHEERWDPVSETLLNYAAREDHLVRIIRPALETGSWVVCDRFLDSTRAYQGGAGGVDAGFLDALERAVVAPTYPDLTLILDLDVETGLARAAARNGGSGEAEQRFEGKGRAFHDTLRAAFRDIAEREPGRCALVDASQDPQSVARSIWDCVVRRLLTP